MKIEADPRAPAPEGAVERVRVDEQIAGPGKYEITPEDTFKIEFGLLNKDDRWVVTNPGIKGVDTHSVTFRMWTFDEEVELRKLATLYEREKKMHLIDNDLLNRLKVQRLLKEWTFDKANPRLKLLHVNGVLADEGWDAFRKLHTNITRQIIEQMNNILEYNV